MSGVLLGMLVRLATPAAAWIACQLWAPDWMALGFAEALLVLYLVGLAAETTLIVQTIPRYRPRGTGSAPAKPPARTV